MKVLTKEEWLTNIPELIYHLKKNYNFYYSGFCCRISKDILEIIKNPKHRHKIILYNKNNRFFLVVYTKNGADIYATMDYKEETKGKISYFVQKFKRAYKKAEAEYEIQQFQEDFHLN